MSLEQSLRLKLKTALNRLRMGFGIADWVRSKRRWIVHDIARVQRSGIWIPQANVTRAMPGQVDDLKFQSPDIENVAILDGTIDLDGSIPIFFDDRGILQPKAFSRLKVKVLQHRLGGDPKARDVLPSRHQHRIFDHWTIQRMTNHSCAIALFEH
jgi:hypothetical protein